MVGPVVTGALISLTATGPFADTNGFQATRLVPAVAVLASLALLPRLELAG
jgi:hypothetical protein